MDDSSHAVLERILVEQPRFHTGEPEVQGAFGVPAGTVLSAEERRRIETAEPFFMGLDHETARFLLEAAGPGQATLETGAGISTLVFAMRGCRHTAVTPNQGEHAAIRAYAARLGIDTAGVRFVAEPSEAYLPRQEGGPLDLVLVDGKHAFPWPILDWFFTADRLETGGLMILDDTQLRPVALVRDFLEADDGWTAEFRSAKAVAFRKRCQSAQNVPWYLQRYVVEGYRPPGQKPFLSRAWRKIRRAIRGR